MNPMASTLANRLWPLDNTTSRTFAVTRFVLLALAGSIILTLSAKIIVPFYPVYMNLQTLAILVIAAAYGRNLAVTTVLLYLAQGAMGLPVFTGTPENGIGIPYMMGPTGGYLMGFIVAAAIIGEAADRGWGNSVLKIGAVMFLGLTIIFALGVTWLTTLIGFEGAITLGLMPFVLGDAAKLGIAALGVPAATALVTRKDNGGSNA